MLFNKIREFGKWELDKFILLIVGIIVFVVFIMCSDLDRNKKNKEEFNNNPKVWGIIEDVRTEDYWVLGWHNVTIYVDIRYLIDGKMYSKTHVYNKATEDMIGQSILVAYEEDNPEKIYIDIYGSDSLFGLLNEDKFDLLIIGVVIAAICGIYFYGRRIA